MLTRIGDWLRAQHLLHTWQAPEKVFPTGMGYILWGYCVVQRCSRCSEIFIVKAPPRPWRPEGISQRAKDLCTRANL